MRHSTLRSKLSAALAALPLTLALFAPAAHAQTETVLYSFLSQSGDGYHPSAGLIFDKKGNLYGTASSGGEYNGGTVFELTAEGEENVLYSFEPYSGNGDGYDPNAGVVFDKKGNLYGTTTDGGEYGNGTVFELSYSKKTKTYSEKVLYSFGGYAGDGYLPYAGLIFDTQGNLYGTTFGGGEYDGGTVFELTSEGTEKLLHSFGSQSGDGYSPYASLVFDKKGNLYGTTSAGGAYGTSCGYGCGTVFELTSAGVETVLYSFGNPEYGYSPRAGLIFDKKGNLYGTAFEGGEYSAGTVFELAYSKKTQTYSAKVLYSFGSQSGDGNYPLAGLVFDTTGNLYGTTIQGGEYTDGTVFELTPEGAETVLHSFDPYSGDGVAPDAGLVFDKEGNLYGTTVSGGGKGGGTVFEVTP